MEDEVVGIGLYEWAIALSWGWEPGASQRAATWGTQQRDQSEVCEKSTGQPAPAGKLGTAGEAAGL